MQSNPTAPDSSSTADRDAIIAGAVVGVLTGFVLWMWQRADEANLSASEARTIIDGFSRGETGGGPSYPWPVAHPFLTALIVAVIVTVVIRGYAFMRRLEER